jgi:hypothetical protein
MYFLNTGMVLGVGVVVDFHPEGNLHDLGPNVGALRGVEHLAGSAAVKVRRVRPGSTPRRRGQNSIRGYDQVFF